MRSTFNSLQKNQATWIKNVEQTKENIELIYKRYNFRKTVQSTPNNGYSSEKRACSNTSSVSSLKKTPEAFNILSDQRSSICSE